MDTWREGSKFSNFSDLNSKVWRDTFEDLDRFSTEYLNRMHALRVWPTAYPWPVDALCCNTRIWEYPFVWHAIQKYKPAGRILDVGSALTFFPLFLASRGYQVLATDIDSRMKEWNAQMLPRLDNQMLSQNMEYRTIDVGSIGPDLGAFDIVTSVSVFEHLPRIELERGLRSVKNILKAGGLFIFTIDCLVAGERYGDMQPLNQVEFDNFLDCVSRDFEPISPPVTYLPCDLLTNVRFPEWISQKSAYKRKTNRSSAWSRRKDYLKRFLDGRPIMPRLEWCAYGAIFRKRS